MEETGFIHSRPAEKETQRTPAKPPCASQSTIRLRKSLQDQAASQWISSSLRSNRKGNSSSCYCCWQKGQESRLQKSVKKKRLTNHCSRRPESGATELKH